VLGMEREAGGAVGAMCYGEEEEALCAAVMRGSQREPMRAYESLCLLFV